MLQISLDISASAQIQFLCGWFISNLPEQYQLKPQQSNVSWAQSKDQSHLKFFLSLSFNSWSEKIMFWRDFNYKEKPYWILSGWQLLSAQSRDSKGISKLPQIQLTLPYEISFNNCSSDIPLISLAQSYSWLLLSSEVNHQQTADSSPLIISPMMSTELPTPNTHQAQSFSFICPQHIMIHEVWMKILYVKDKGHCPQTKSLIQSCLEFQSCRVCWWHGLNLSCQTF